MTLRTALVIEGSAEGARKAAQDTVGSINEVKRAATDASAATASVAGNLEKASAGAGAAASEIKSLPPAVEETSGAFERLGRTVDAVPQKFGAVRTAVLGFVGGIAGGAALGAVSGVMEAAIGGLITYASNALTKTDEVDAALKSHVALIKSIKGAYAEAEGGASSYGRNSVAVLRFNAQQDQQRLQQAYKDALPDGGLFNTGVFAEGTGGFSDAQLGPYAEAIRTFRADLQGGRADVIALRSEIAGIAAEQPADSAFRKVAESILADTELASETLSELRRSQEVLKGLQGDSEAAVRALGGAAEKYDGLGAAAGSAAGAVLPTTEAIRNSGSAAETAAGQIERYKAALGTIGGTGTVTISPARASATPTAFAAGGVVDHPVLFSYGGDRTGLMGEAGPEAILPLAGGRVRAITQGGAEITLDLARMSDGVLGVVLPEAFADGGTLGGIYGGYDGGFGGGYGTGYTRGLANEVNFFRGSVSGFVAGLRQGQSALESFGSVVTRISDRALDAALGALDKLAFGGGGFGGGVFGGGGIGKLFGSILGMSQWDMAASGLITGLFHGGGEIGRSATATRLVSPAVFSGAPRMHRGGTAGMFGGSLSGSEVPIIAEAGEEIGWPSDLARKYGRGGQTNNFYIETPDVRSFSESRASVARTAARLSSRAGRYV